VRTAFEGDRDGRIRRLVVGFVVAYRQMGLRFAVILIVPLAAAALEIVVNTMRFGVRSMAVWSLVLVVLTVGATALGGAGGRWLAARRHAPRRP
jgi:hypothetical protein